MLTVRVSRTTFFLNQNDFTIVSEFFTKNCISLSYMNISNNFDKMLNRDTPTKWNWLRSNKMLCILQIANAFFDRFIFCFDSNVIEIYSQWIRWLWVSTRAVDWCGEQATNLIARFVGTHLGPTGPRWAPCWPNELCYLGSHYMKQWWPMHKSSQSSKTFLDQFDILTNLLENRQPMGIES